MFGELLPFLLLFGQVLGDTKPSPPPPSPPAFYTVPFFQPCPNETATSAVGCLLNRATRKQGIRYTPVFCVLDSYQRPQLRNGTIFTFTKSGRNQTSWTEYDCVYGAGGSLFCFACPSINIEAHQQANHHVDRVEQPPAETIRTTCQNDVALIDWATKAVSSPVPSYVRASDDDMTGALQSTCEACAQNSCSYKIVNTNLSAPGDICYVSDFGDTRIHSNAGALGFGFDYTFSEGDIHCGCTSSLPVQYTISYGDYHHDTHTDGSSESRAQDICPFYACNVDPQCIGVIFYQNGIFGTINYQTHCVAVTAWTNQAVTSAGTCAPVVSQGSVLLRKTRLGAVCPTPTNNTALSIQSATDRGSIQFDADPCTLFAETCT